MDQLILQSFLLALDLYKTHAKKAADWVPTAEDIAALRMKNLQMTVHQYELDAAQRLGLPVPTDPFAPAALPPPTDTGMGS